MTQPVRCDYLIIRLVFVYLWNDKLLTVLKKSFFFHFFLRYLTLYSQTETLMYNTSRPRSFVSPAVKKMHITLTFLRKQGDRAANLYDKNKSIELQMFAFTSQCITAFNSVSNKIQCFKFFFLFIYLPGYLSLKSKGTGHDKQKINSATDTPSKFEHQRIE